jgi:hypothetical protein
MKRRQTGGSPVEPSARLRSFDPTDWPGEDPLRQWKVARKEHAKLHGWPSGQDPWGDELTELIERREILARMAGS